jgi:hypothetical protein
MRRRGRPQTSPEMQSAHTNLVSLDALTVLLGTFETISCGALRFSSVLNCQKHCVSIPYRLKRSLVLAAYLFFLFVVAFVCYRRPVPDDFDRYIYEAILRGRSQPVEVVYNLVKHESPRTEASSILDSPQHLRELEPLYAIRPLYLGIVALAGTVVPIQQAISLVSAASLFGIGVIVLLWTQRPVLSGLLIAASPVAELGRIGSPDALAALFAISALWLIERQKPYFGLLLLFLSLGVRTDNVLTLWSVVAWLVWEHRVSPLAAGAQALAAVGIVFLIDHWAGNYGWVVLFRFSFIAGRYPALIPHTLTLGEYLSACGRGAAVIFSQFSIWLFLGWLAWMRRPRPLLAVVAIAVVAHFLLFPSPEVRYLTWAGIVAAVMLILSFDENSLGKTAAEGPQAVARSSGGI